jgi:gliding motility-associated-like protein
MKHFLIILFAFFSLNTFACDKASASLVSETDNGNGTYTYVVNICLEMSDMLGAPDVFTLTPSGGSYTSLVANSTTPSSFNNSGDIYNRSISGSKISYTYSGFIPNSTPSLWCTPTVTFTTNGRPSKITVMTNDNYGGTTCDKVLTIPSCSNPATPTITTTAATCSAAGTSTISNYGAGNTYAFTPAGPTAGAGGVITGMTPGTSYTVTASAGGCTSTASSSFSNSAQLVTPSAPTATLTQPTCSVATGTITITAPTGAGYTYAKDGVTFQAGTSFSALTANSYTITVKNGSGCTNTANFTINAAPGAPSTPTATLTQPTCSVATGQIDVTAPTGVGYTYSKDGVTFQAGTSFTALTPNTYTITAKDGSGCTSTANFTINAAPGAPATPTATLTQPTCSVATGQIDITAPTGVGYTYSKDGVTFQAGTSFTALTPNTYTITAKDGSGCTSTANFTINAAPGAPATPTATLTQPTCSVATGQIDITAPTGVGYTYSKDGVTFQAGTSFTALTPNSYTITAKDGSGCTSTANFTINAAPSAPATPTATLTQPTCSVATGQIDITVPTGVGYTYSKDGVTFQAGTSFTALTPNTYTITAKDGSGCTSTANFTINVAPGAPATPTATLTQPTCSVATGQIDITAPTGVGYTYSKDGVTFQAGTSFTALTPNTYTITAKDGAGCTSTTNFTINAAPGAPATPTATLTQPTCSVATGQIDITAPTGVGYTYSKDGVTFQAGTSFTALTPNTYTITVKDGSGCTSSASFTINSAPTQPVLTITDPASVCSPSTVDLTSNSIITGSTGVLVGGITYWSDAGASSAVTIPNAISSTGTYYIKAVNGSCSDIKPVNVTVNTCTCPVALTITDPNAVCSPLGVDLTSPSITAGSTGVGTFTYWQDGSATTPLSNYSNITTSGTYYIKMSGGACTDIKPVTVTINQTPNLVITDPASVCSPNTVNITNASVTAGSTGGGTLSYWKDNLASQTEATPSSIATSGVYYIKATTAAGCSDFKPVNVSVNVTPTLVITNPATVCSPNVIDLTANTITTGSTNIGTLTYWNDALATSNFTTPGNVSQSNTYYIKAQNGNCSDIKPVIVTINQTPALSITSPSAVCSPNTIDITQPSVTSGTIGNGILTYWNDNLATSTLTNPSAISTSGTYYIKSTENGCTDVKSVNVIVNTTPTLVINNPANTCSPNTVDITNNAVTLGSTNGTNLTYWTDNLATTPLINPSSLSISGTYYIKSTLNNCSDVKPVNVTVNTSPNLVITDPTPVCEPGTINLLDPLITSGSTNTGIFSYYSDAQCTNLINNPGGYNTNGVNTVYVKTTNNFGCVDIKPVVVTLNSLDVISITAPTSLCSNSPLEQIQATPINGNWVGSGITSLGALQASKATIGKNNYTYTSSGICPTSKTIQIEIFTKPILKIAKSDTICVGEEVKIQDVTPNVNLITCEWNFGDNTISNDLQETKHTYLFSGDYDITLIGKDENNCYDTLTEPKFIRVLDRPIANFSFTPEKPTIFNNTIQTFNKSINATEYLWNFGDGIESKDVNPTHKFNPIPGIYFINLSAKNEINSCTHDTLIQIEVFDEVYFYVPNSFTPNGDEINNDFRPVLSGAVAEDHYSLYIFNRWGELLFESHNKNVGWNGSFGNKICMPDTYIWKIEFRDTINKEKHMKTGHVNLIQ